VGEEHRLKGNWPSSAAFYPDPPNPSVKKPYLSVNALEVETTKAIAAYHRGVQQGNRGKVALCDHTVFQYNDAAKKSGVAISYDQADAKWKFRSGTSALEDAYRHVPSVESKHEFKSPSHCGAEFTRALTAHTIAKFARHMTKKRFHLS
jgi:hypothetical protein